MIKRIYAMAYLVRILRNERPGRSVVGFIAKTLFISTDDLCRIADAIYRFDLDNIL